MFSLQSGSGKKSQAKRAKKAKTIEVLEEDDDEHCKFFIPFLYNIAL